MGSSWSSVVSGVPTQGRCTEGSRRCARHNRKGFSWEEAQRLGYDTCLSFVSCTGINLTVSIGVQGIPSEPSEGAQAGSFHINTGSVEPLTSVTMGFTLNGASQDKQEPSPTVS